MRSNLSIWLSLLIALLFTAFIWQIAEPEVVTFFGKACYKITKHSFLEVNTRDKAGIPMHYYPKVGTVYDPEIAAMEASRFYATRIDPIREKGFLLLSDWLVKQVDASGLIPQTYDFPAASLKQPWYSAATQSAAMLAIAQRAGYLRNKELLNIANNMLNNLDPLIGDLSRATTDSTTWFIGYPDYDIRGMLNTMLNLHKYFVLTGDPKADDLFRHGLTMLRYKLVNLEKRGYLEDRYTRIGKRLEHRQLTALLEELNKISPNPIVSADIARYKRLDKQLAGYQMLVRNSWAGIVGFVVLWLLLSYIVHAFLRVPK